MPPPAKRIAVIGAGPIGLEAALLAAQHGFDVAVYESRIVANNVREWGHVRLFSPFAMNSSPWGRTSVAAVCGAQALPADDAIMTGREFAESYVRPLSRLPELRGRIFEEACVKSISRGRTWKRELIGEAARGRDPFVLLVDRPGGERLVHADLVFDCSGAYPRHNWIGAGGMPCPGESLALTAKDYLIPDIAGGDRAAFAGRRTLVIGGGHSAATAIVSLTELSADVPQTRALWITRSPRHPPLIRLPHDPLAERDRLSARANEAASNSNGPVDWRPATFIRRISLAPGSDTYVVTVESEGRQAGQPSAPQEIPVDRVIANVGYRPDQRLFEELQAQLCYATDGPLRLAAELLGEASTDCLQQAAHGAASLVHPEPGFFILGSKSYGRDSRFLMSAGIQQVRDVVAMLHRAVVTQRQNETG